MEKRLRSSLDSSPDEFLSTVTKLSLKSSKPSLKSLLHSIAPHSSSLSSSSFPLSLHRSITQSIASFQNLTRTSPPASPADFASPPSKRLRRSARISKTAIQPQSNASTSNVDRRKHKAAEKLQILAHVAYLCVTSPHRAFSASDFLPAVQALHDNLILFESDSVLSSEIVNLCEVWWKEELPGKETLISQFLPFLLSRSLTVKKKVDVHRVYVLRDAFSLFDYEDNSIEDLKLLLIRCVIEPLYLMSEDGRRFVAFMFSLSGQLVKDALAMVKSQIPFGRKSMLEAYGDILFSVWKVAEGGLKEEIENGFLQSMIEGAILASSAVLAASIRRVLGGFINQRTIDGVEKILFRLTEPVLFRSLQVANSNVRQNALHLLLDMFPLEDPDATKEIKHGLLDRQFYLLERLLLDDCPDVRVVAVEGCCRILNLFWEVIPSSTITKILTKVFDDMSYDVCSDVRLSTVNGIMYLLGNMQSHEVLKVLLPRLGHLITDGALSVRVAVVDLLLLIRDIRSFQFNKVVSLEALLLSLANDQAQVSQKITKLLMPSYFPSRVALEEACHRCLTLIKRSPRAGANFCKYVVDVGASLKSLMQLFKVFISFVLSTDVLNEEQIEGLLNAASHVCETLVIEPSYKTSLKEMFSNDKIKCLFAAAPTAHAQSSVLSIVSAISPDDVSGIVKGCMKLVLDCIDVFANEGRQSELRSAHKLLLSCDRSNVMFEAFARLLKNTAILCHKNFEIDILEHSISSLKRKKGHPSLKTSGKKRNVSQSMSSSFEDEYMTAVGIAWQIKDLLVSEDGRRAMLCSSYLEVIFHALKVIAQVSILECASYEYMSIYPVLAYTTLVLHRAATNVSLNSTSSSSRTIVEVIDDLLNWSEKMLGAGWSSEYGQSFEMNAPCFEQDHEQQVTGSSRSNIGGSIKSTEETIFRKVKMLTAILKFTLDASTMRFYSCGSRRCLNFASSSVRHVISDLRKLSSDSLQLNEDEMKEKVVCLKSSLTYMVKLLNLAGTDNADASPPLLESFSLANQLLDLILCIELSLGSGYAMRIVAAAKPWLPDLVVALGYAHIMNKSHGDVSSTLSDITNHFPLWPSIVARIEVNELCEDGCEETDGTVSRSKYLTFKKVMGMVVVLLRANPNLLDAFGMIFMAGSTIGLERNDFGLVLGLLRFVIVKVVGQENRHWNEYSMLLASLQRIYSQTEKKVEKLQGEGFNQLSAVRALLEPVWRHHHTDGTGMPFEMDE